MNINMLKKLKMERRFCKQGILIVILLTTILQSCSSKKNILYFQDAQFHRWEDIKYPKVTIKPNDILSIVVSTPIVEAAIPYNVAAGSAVANFDIESLKLRGYLVSDKGTIDFPVLGEIGLNDLTLDEAQEEIQKQLNQGGHLKDASVKMRMLNSKVTVLGDVKSPGTFNYTENRISLPQALGFAGDLNITGKRKEILIIREENGSRMINQIDLRTADWFTGPFYYIKPNDIIVVKPNKTKVKSAGLVGNASVVLTIVSILLSTAILVTR